MYTTKLDIRTHRRDEFVDISDKVRQALQDSGVQQGLLTVYVPHTTAGVTINENADPDVISDILESLDRAVPWRSEAYLHSEGNSAAHVKSSLLGCSIGIPVIGGRLVLGTWQGVFFCEFDGPRSRQAIVTVLNSP